MNNIILHITAGQGPKECQWVVFRLAEAFRKEASALRLSCEIIHDAKEASASLLLSVTGKGCETFAAERTGTIRWIGESPFRSRHKRKNWYVGVKRAPDFDDIPKLQDGDIKYQAIRASGPGGQHVNKTDSAVRATHIPTGVSSISQDQRSQFANKKIARMKLALIFEEQKEMELSRSKQGLWQQSRELEKGNEVRCYEGHKFKLK
ncbi:peptide chain release factor H [Parasphingorhabdus sp.]|uniref:peptide chain release factor H n=1 Tax=Parasphingorhabdus sp. TaxID=2709688 RepID=UPI003263DFAE